MVSDGQRWSGVKVPKGEWVGNKHHMSSQADANISTSLPPPQSLPPSTKPAAKKQLENDNDSTSTSNTDDEKGIYGFDQDIVQAESAEAPFRKLRLVSYGVLALIAVVLGGVSLAGMAGVEELKELGENLPNPLLDAAVLGLAFYLWVEEVSGRVLPLG